MLRVSEELSDLSNTNSVQAATSLSIPLIPRSKITVNGLSVLSLMDIARKLNQGLLARVPMLRLKQVAAAKPRGGHDRMRLPHSHWTLLLQQDPGRASLIRHPLFVSFLL
jgi:hypothetical protein